MIDTYIQSEDEAAITSFCESQNNVIGPTKGTEAVFDEEGVLLSPAQGDAQTWYACIRSPTAISPPPPITICQPELGLTILGTWA